jgi:hypothetical protein
VSFNGYQEESGDEEKSESETENEEKVGFFPRFSISFRNHSS